MADRQRGESKELRHDQARGDWARSRRHTDEERSRDEASPGDDGLRPPEG